jgi:hypothetical protein
MKLLKFFDWVESFSIPEMILIFVFVLYVLLPINPSVQVAQFFDSALGMATLFFLTLAFFVITHPVVGVIYIFVAYETLRRSSLKIQHIPVIHAPTLAAARAGTQSSNQALQQMRSTGSGYISTMNPQSAVSASVGEPNLLKPRNKAGSFPTEPAILRATKGDAIPKDKFYNGISASQHQAPLIKEGGVDFGTQEIKDQKMKELNPPVKKTLEEELISKFGPLDAAPKLSYEAPTFKPVATKLPASVFQ